jgi:hypothetical protein
MMGSKNLEVLYYDVKKIIPYVNNSRTHTNEQIDQVASSIKEFGFTNPILIDDGGNLVAGHARLQAAIKLGMDSIPCIILDGLTDAQKRAYVIADNKLALNADWDIELLLSEIEELKHDEFDIGLLGFSDEELQQLASGLCESEGDGSQSDAPNPYTKTVATPLYMPDDQKPAYEEMYQTQKLNELLEKINTKDISPEVKNFLIAAAYRHVRFNYEKIANFYAHSDKSIQELMEDSALVIIDYNKAIEQGYLHLSNEVDGFYAQEH